MEIFYDDDPSIAQLRTVRAELTLGELTSSTSLDRFGTACTKLLRGSGRRARLARRARTRRLLPEPRRSKPRRDGSARTTHQPRACGTTCPGAAKSRPYRPVSGGRRRRMQNAFVDLFRRGRAFNDAHRGRAPPRSSGMREAREMSTRKPPHEGARNWRRHGIDSAVPLPPKEAEPGLDPTLDSEIDARRGTTMRQRGSPSIFAISRLGRGRPRPSPARCGPQTGGTRASDPRSSSTGWPPTADRPR